MDQSADVERAVEEMEWGELVSTLQAVIEEMLEYTSNPPPPSSPPPPVPAGVFDTTHPQPVENLSGGYGGCIPLGAAPHSSEQPSPLMAAPGLNAGQAAPIMYQGPLYHQNSVQSGHPYSQQAGAYSQGQYLPYQWPANDVPTAAAVTHPAAPPHPSNGVPVVRLPEGLGQNLHRVGVLNGEVLEVKDGFAPSDSAAPQLNTSVSKKIKRDNQHDEDRPYIKKPPNAFMLFMKEQRGNVVAELNLRDNAAVNTILGQRWKLLSKEEQDRYYQQATTERLLHAQQNPQWSSRDNYGKKRKRQRCKAPTRIEASASKTAEVTQQAKKLCVTPGQTAVMEPSPLQTCVMEAPHTQTAGTLPVCNICHLPMMYDVYLLDSPRPASTAPVSPAAPSETQTTEFSHLFTDVSDGGAA